MTRSPLMQKFPEFKSPTDEQGQFYSFEGIEGSGKSTQISKLVEYFETQGRRVLKLREPGGTVFGEKLRDAILHSKEGLAPLSEAHLFASARAQLLKEKILPALEDPNAVVLLDRYIDSSLAYQGFARGLGIEEILRIHQAYPLCLLPNRTFFLSISPEESLKRQETRGQVKDYFESEKFEFTQKLAEGFQKCREYFPERIVQINGSLSPSEVHQEVKANLKN